MREEALNLGPNRSNIGVFTPANDETGAQSDIAAICLNAGLLHHVGPHRMHVLLARALARVGICTLRFDLSGIGDSSVRSDDLPAQEIPLQEINNAIDELEARGIKRFILFGICSGAVQAAKAALGNPKIAGIVMVNSGADDGSPEANPEAVAQFYFKGSLWRLSAWKNFVTGKVRYRLLFGTLFAALIHRLRGKTKNKVPMEEGFRAGIQHFVDQGTSILMVLSDRHAQFYTMYQEMFENMQSAKFKTLVYAETDHLFTSLTEQQDLIDQLCLWSGGLVSESHDSQ